MTQRIISQVHADDIAYCVHLAKNFTDQIGFLPTSALTHYAALGGVIKAQENGDDAGYIAGTTSKADMPRVAQIYQAAVQMDAQRRAIGLALVATFETKASLAGAHGVQLWCATDLESNEFWRAAGYTTVATRRGGRRRGRDHILWKKAIASTFDLFSVKTTSQEARRSVRMTLDVLWDRPLLDLLEGRPER